MQKFSVKEEKYIRKFNKKFNKKFNRNVDVLKTLQEDTHITRSRYNEEEKQFFVDNKHLPINEIIKLYKDRFGEELTYHQVQAFRRRNKLGKSKNKNAVIGTESLHGDGLIWVKVAEPDVWVKKQKYLYEKYKGEVPKNASVIFLDGDKTNYDLDNLVLSTSQEYKIMRKKKLMYKDKDMRRTGSLIAKLLLKIRRLKEEHINIYD